MPRPTLFATLTGSPFYHLSPRSGVSEDYTNILRMGSVKVIQKYSSEVRFIATHCGRLFLRSTESITSVLLKKRVRSQRSDYNHALKTFFCVWRPFIYTGVTGESAVTPV